MYMYHDTQSYPFTQLNEPKIQNVIKFPEVVAATNKKKVTLKRQDVQFIWFFCLSKDGNNKIKVTLITFLVPNEIGNGLVVCYSYITITNSSELKMLNLLVCYDQIMNQ